MCSDDVVISARGLGKAYKIYDQPLGRLKQLFAFGGKKHYREFHALRDVSFDIRRGETVGIIGRNGSGKSTLLQLICGIRKPTAGEVTVKGRVSALLELGAGFHPEFTGRENVLMQGAIMGFTRAEMETRFDDIAAFADIGDFIDQPVRAYSSGMFVRLAFATMAHVDADILIIDEALAVGDAIFAQRCMRFLADFREHGTLVLVSHDLATINALCDRALWLEGRVRGQGDVHEVCENYLVASFGKLSLPVVEAANEDLGFADQRQELLNCSNLRNDLEVFRFNPIAAGSGTGLAIILDAWMENAAGTRYCYVVGGEQVTLIIRARAFAMLESPIIGFIVKDHLGQPLVGDNTYLSYASKPVATPEGALLEARFHFRMPRLPTGDYTVCVTIADGVPGMHQTHHRINEAITIHSQASSVAQVLVGLPMLKIDLAIVPQNDSRP